MDPRNRPKSKSRSGGLMDHGTDADQDESFSGQDSAAGRKVLGSTTSCPTASGLKARAVRLLSMREHSRKELARKLSVYAPDQQSLEQVLDALEREGWQSDQRFVQSFEHASLHRYGSVRIAMAMRERGVDEELVRESLDRIKDSELERAWAIWNKRFGQQGLPAEPKAYARQARFLASRGFTGEVVSKILTGRFDGSQES